jgi:hypothetical protein
METGVEQRSDTKDTSSSVNPKSTLHLVGDHE